MKKRQRNSNNNNTIDPITQHKIPPSQKIRLSSIDMNSHGLANMLTSGITKHPLTGRELHLNDRKRIMDHAIRSGWARKPPDTNTHIPAHLRDDVASNSKQLRHALRRQRLASMLNLVTHHGAYAKTVDRIEHILKHCEAAEDLVRQLGRKLKNFLAGQKVDLENFLKPRKEGGISMYVRFSGYNTVNLHVDNAKLGLRLVFGLRGDSVESVKMSFGGSMPISITFHSFDEKVPRASFSFSKGVWIVSDQDVYFTLLPGYHQATHLRNYKLPPNTNVEGTGLSWLVFIAAIVQGLGMHAVVPVNRGHLNGYVEAVPLFEVITNLKLARS